MKVLDVTKAACREVDPEIFFPVSAINSAAAKYVCWSCQMRQECLDYAIDTGQQFGIWGGENLEERQAEVRRRNKEARLAATVEMERGRLAKAAKLHRAGLKPLEIAEEMRVSLRTVEKYLQLGGVA